jgi:hypothetical protein
MIQGRRDVLAGKLLTVYGKTKEQTEKEIAAFEASCRSCGTAKPLGEEAESTDSV